MGYLIMHNLLLQKPEFIYIPNVTDADFEALKQSLKKDKFEFDTRQKSIKAAWKWRRKKKLMLT